MAYFSYPDGDVLKAEIIFHASLPNTVYSKSIC